MSNTQLYCSVQEVITDLKLTGDEPRMLQRIRDASQFVERQIGQFLPVTSTRTFAGVSTETLNIKQPLLTISAVRVDGVAVTDYTPWPAARCWDRGPYTWLTRAAGWGTTVEIDGIWGLYDDSQYLDISVDQTIDALTLAVADGSLLSPGMVLLVGSEQELVTAGNGGDRSPAATAATSVVTAAVDPAVEAISVTNGAEFRAGEVLQIGAEDLYIRKIGGNQLICHRGWNGTTQAAYLANAAIRVYRTYTVQRAVNGTTAAAHATAAALRCMPPADIYWLTVQIAALMRQKAQTAFGGRAGNPETGETFYINEFPRLQIDKIAENYAIPYL